MSKRLSLSERQMSVAVELQEAAQRLLSASMDMTSTVVDSGDLDSDSRIVDDVYDSLGGRAIALDELARDAEESGL